MKTDHGQRDSVAKRHKRSRIRLHLFASLLLSAAVCGFAVPADSAERVSVPSYGQGPKELIVFTDYFCPPCMTIETEMEPAILKLLAEGRVKITFVDVPGHRYTALYAKYFLFATQGASGYKNAMHAREVLFALAKQNLAKTDTEIEKAFSEKGVAFKAFNPKPVYAEWNKIIDRYKIGTTPTCILKHSEAKVLTYAGTHEIRNGLLPELKALGKKQP